MSRTISSSDPSTDASWLDASLEILMDRGEPRSVVRIVERWATSGEPTTHALLLQAQAFLQLNLMDRAWVRLKEVGEREPENVQALLLTAQMFIERGWPLRARKLLARVEDDSELAQHLRAAAEQPALAPPKQAREIEAEGTPQQQLELAERFMAAGTFLRAKSILERLRRKGGPTEPRAELLLWALGGGFVNEGGDPGALLLELAPELEGVDESNTLDRESTFDEPFGEGEVTSTGLAQEESGGSDEGFPALFRRAELPRDHNTTEEVTAVSGLASPAELQHRDPTEETYSGGGGIVSGDTQIMMVIRKDGQQEDADGEHHTLGQEDDGLRETLNLRDYLSHMGMDPALSDLDGDEVDLEEEDDDLIVVTRRERPTREPTEELDLDQPVQVVEKPLAPIHPPELLEEDEERTIGAPAPAIRPRDPEPTSPDPVADAPLEPQSADEGRLSRWLGLAIIALVLLVVAAVTGVFVSQRLASNAVVDHALQVVATADQRALQELEASLESQLAEHPQDGALQASYALVELVLWREFTGDPVRLEQGSAAAAAAAQLKGGGEPMALAYAYRALAQGDLETAAQNLEAAGDSAEAKAVAAMIALEADQPAEAVQRSREAVALSDAPRYHQMLAQSCLEAGDQPCAQAQLAGMGEGASAQLMALRVQDQGSAEQRLEQVEALLEGPLPLRVASDAQLLRSELLVELDRPEGALLALHEALREDLDNPELLLHRAALEASLGRQRRALAALERAARVRPLDMELHTARVAVLLELDRVESASELVQALPEAPRKQVLQAWVAQAEGGEPAADLQASTDPLAQYVLAWGQGAQRGESAKELEGVAQQLRASDEPFLSRLAGPVEALAALRSGGETQQAILRDSSDPLALLALAQAVSEDQPQLAAGLLDRCTESAGALARAHYERGRVYKLLGRESESRVSLRAYLELSPDGPRAVQARGQLARR